MRRERKENVYISSPQKLLLEQQRNATTSSSICKATSKCKKTAHKISENVYTVNHSKQKSTQNNNNNESQSGNFTEEMKEKLQAELVHLAMLQNIDFKFDDAKQTNEVQKIENEDNETPLSQLTTPPSGKLHTMCSVDEEYENCFKAANSASRLLHKYATLAKYGGHTSPLAATALHNTPNRKHHLKQHQAINQTNNISKSANNTPAINKQTEKMCISTSKMESNSSSPGSNDIEIPKKFASLPRFKKIDFSPLKLRINNVLQRNQQNEY